MSLSGVVWWVTPAGFFMDQRPGVVDEMCGLDVLGKLVKCIPAVRRQSRVKNRDSQFGRLAIGNRFRFQAEKMGLKAVMDKSKMSHVHEPEAPRPGLYMNTNFVRCNDRYKIPKFSEHLQSQKVQTNQRL
ncbi:hypothetical protein NEUTE1DRAFT_37796 [Neurospora tetrasperma FGSC 2508]|uniref:Uncharacterized protein n=1 Tax=Neurospora tetrasperma (strain FGSC 2508 / ATCC MYA-4615 / P0657) TaxID=510951 RepID=F8MGW1_NEUT8|nr:uncharacterized protein NEUTE1DRAFT_37796 [Neurospora tetrasperma FGSC 2508]EGO58680.1 hypothetical protein NEUTE1DRAFT_37796 [Neurospora tetrasperma FGSC 2508]EGZ72767.1 hypothetical protein NEUTE2DRAFT_60920 [Neurospora tetrasperma FGSC 2509]